jgi:hypothetical protein
LLPCANAAPSSSSTTCMMSMMSFLFVWRENGREAVQMLRCVGKDSYYRPHVSLSCIANFCCSQAYLGSLMTSVLY